MSRFIILVERKPTVVIPLVNAEDNDWMHIYPSLEEARATAAEHPLCRAFNYQILDLDNTEDLS
jgi:hypothetical protein